MCVLSVRKDKQIKVCNHRRKCRKMASAAELRAELSSEMLLPKSDFEMLNSLSAVIRVPAVAAGR